MNQASERRLGRLQTCLVHVDQNYTLLRRVKCPHLCQNSCTCKPKKAAERTQIWEKTHESHLGAGLHQERLIECSSKPSVVSGLGPVGIWMSVSTGSMTKDTFAGAWDSEAFCLTSSTPQSQALGPEFRNPKLRTLNSETPSPNGLQYGPKTYKGFYKHGFPESPL